MPLVTDAQRGIEPGTVIAYSYDSRNRLVFAEESVGSTVNASWTYAYDNASNRTQQIRTGDTGSAAGTIDYGYNAANQLTSMTGQSTSWTYDAAGNQTTNGATVESATYGDRGERTAVDSVSSDYFGVGNTDRLSNTSHTFDNGALGLMHRGDTVSQQRLTRAPDGQVVSIRGDASYYYIHDHLGSIIAMISDTGSYVGGYAYGPYGEERDFSPGVIATDNPLRYIGEHREADGTYKFGARYYDPSQGRFSQMDPSGQEANPYAYANCNPINAKDPSVLSSCLSWVTKAIVSSVQLLAAFGSLLAVNPITLGLMVIGTVIMASLHTIAVASGIARTVYCAGMAVNACRG